MLLGLIVMYAIGPQRANVLNNAYGTDFYSNIYFFLKQTASLGLALGAFALFQGFELVTGVNQHHFVFVVRMFVFIQYPQIGVYAGVKEFIGGQLNHGFYDVAIQHPFADIAFC